MLRETVRETNSSERAAEAAKIDKDEGINNTNTWSDKVEAKLEKTDAEVDRLLTGTFRPNRSARRTFDLELNLHESKLKLHHELALSKTKNAKCSYDP